jgi:hypothetical protein
MKVNKTVNDGDSVLLHTRGTPFPSGMKHVLHAVGPNCGIPKYDPKNDSNLGSNTKKNRMAAL